MSDAIAKMRWNADWPGVAVAFCRPKERWNIFNFERKEHRGKGRLTGFNGINWRV